MSLVVIVKFDTVVYLASDGREMGPLANGIREPVREDCCKFVDLGPDVALAMTNDARSCDLVSERTASALRSRTASTFMDAVRAVSSAVASTRAERPTKSFAAALVGIDRIVGRARVVEWGRPEYQPLELLGDVLQSIGGSDDSLWSKCNDILDRELLPLSPRERTAQAVWNAINKTFDFAATNDSAINRHLFGRTFFV